MHQIDTANAVTVQPAVLAPGPVPDGYFQPGNPGAGQPATSFDQDWCNMVQGEFAAILAAAGIAQVKGTFSQVLASLLKSFNPVVGSARGLAGSCGGAIQAAAWTVEEITAKTALGGQPFIGANLALNFNGAIVGAGGMDTGAMPVSADLSVYAIFDPSTGTWNTLGCAGATSNGPVYSGAHLPAGYTASALIHASVTNAAGQFQGFEQTGRRIRTPRVKVLAAGAAAAYTAVSIASMVPAVATEVSGVVTAYTDTTVFIAPSAAALGEEIFGSASGPVTNWPFGLMIKTPQEFCYYTQTSTTDIYVNGFAF